VRLFLIRHGQTPANVAGELDTAPPGVDLNALGRRQADALVAALADEPFTAIHASPAVRTQQTAAPLAAARGTEVAVTDGLQEIAAGHLELRSDQVAVETYLGCIAAWLLGDRDRRMPGGQSGHEFHARYGDAVRRIASGREPGDTVVAFSHGAAIRAFTGLTASGVDADTIAHQRMVNTGGVLLEGDASSGWRLAQWWTEPLGGADLLDTSAHDVTSEPVDEALADAD
jgi:probable phosphoglycerate mutase